MMKFLQIFCLIFAFLSCDLYAQRDVILQKDSSEIRCKILATSNTQYTYAFINAKNKVVKSTILKSKTDTVIFDKYDGNLVNHKLFEGKAKVILEEEDKPLKPFQFTAGVGISLGNVLEVNSTSGDDKKSFSSSVAIDLGLNYYKEGSKFAMTNELHWSLALQKNGLANTDHIQRAADELITMHDFSMVIRNNNKWNFNLIIKSNTSVFTIFDGDTFKDYNGNGKIQGFLNPYDITLSPGIKYQPNRYFKLSISPYSVNLYGLTKQEIANTGFYTQNFDTNNNYDLFVFKKLGAEMNVWYDRKIKKWLEMQYRLGISSDYLSGLVGEGLLNGLFITKLIVIKNVSLTHRAILKGDLSSKPFKPYYNQLILLSYSKSF